MNSPVAGGKVQAKRSLTTLIRQYVQSGVPSYKVLTQKYQDVSEYKRRIDTKTGIRDLDVTSRIDALKDLSFGLKEPKWNMVRVALTSVRDKIQKNNSYRFNRGDFEHLVVFRNQIDPQLKRTSYAKRGLANTINNIPKGAVCTVFNTALDHDNYKDYEKQLAIDEIEKDLRWMPYIFSVIKNIQDPSRFPLFYKEWCLVVEGLHGFTLDEDYPYDSFCKFYRSHALQRPGMKPSQSVLSDYLNLTVLDCREWLKSIHASQQTLTSFDNMYGDKDPDEVNAEINPNPTPLECLTNLPLNTILYGPPGTGKTFHSIDKALEIVAPDFMAKGPKRNEILEKYRSYSDVDNPQIRFTTFHQSMSYEDFIEGIKPGVSAGNGGSVTYSVQPGLFKTLCEDARNNPHQKYVLIIDEINRGNVSQIFGELISLIEDTKRLGRSDELTVQLPYSQRSLGVPSNIHIIGTMNTADRSVEALDTALRRRFTFVEMPPDPENKDLPGELNGVSVQQLLKTINMRIEKLLSRDHQIGHAYFMNVIDLHDVFEHKIIPLLKEYFYGDYGKIGLILGGAFITKHDSNIAFANFDHEHLAELAIRPTYQIKVPAKGPDFDAALKELVGKS